MLLEFAETPGKSDLLRRREPLVAKDDDLMLEERIRDLGKRAFVQGSRQVDARDFRAKAPAELPDGDHALPNMRGVVGSR